ncbi:unnamed protein product [Soboliphyme baturini]|uniref:protein-tyrosine-phosphatase n=1 Tax=Soboliphyme baturini TaxID=241478 RepID=A0A3P8CQE9_9BILA|nr:unnamed protein product [Soboliphyme baturini]
MTCRCCFPQVRDLLWQKYDSVVSQYLIIDCRYPYEYEAGHIKSAINVYSQDQLFERFFSHALSGRQILIFYCEYSQERGPRMYHNLLRRRDRVLNEPHYPKLYYPEIYLLHRGYRLFHKKFAVSRFRESLFNVHCVNCPLKFDIKYS